MTAGLVIAAPASGSGKTTVTLGLLRLLRRRGLAVAPAKAGPDYIDPAFHAAAGGRASVNLDAWAMRPDGLRGLAVASALEAELLLVEGVMGLFDGGPGGAGSTADLAARLALPVLLVVDAKAQAQSLAALARGFRDHRPDVRVAGVIANRVGGQRHAALIREALAPLGLPLLGALPRRDDLALPSRHLGLVQAREQPELEALLERAADWVAEGLDLERLLALAAPLGPGGARLPGMPPLGQRIAIADDEAFAFAYPHLVAGWRAAGAELTRFSPLQDEAPEREADAVFLPGGYPELHAGRLAGNGRFLAGLRNAAARGAWLYGECGGYMVLGEGLVDAEGARHRMAGLLPLETSFERRRLHLGYRVARTLAATPFGPAGTALRGHEFHYASIVREGSGPRLFAVADAAGEACPEAGFALGTVAGSFLHLIDRG
ncbi:cobyrinic acid a,c-diamide synthase [Tistlia consotensis]|uniref:Cobyrinate a,c-diamide synthase n=1 Tax=Tistlia consotensis USBA 355 TaxID=560819 RepID=A0A1Y6B587_9PROT|nr:cobyrinate a,c-diamide synthase [Tistlia consotensis]SME92917.1 cobyrinic acid a,c-diamide synthase [Tistlia consotensis USBA 355]SNR28350.1 cobyrinic acid a,c-diamide synthase [Tistlia consotensis]